MDDGAVRSCFGVVKLFFFYLLIISFSVVLVLVDLKPQIRFSWTSYVRFPWTSLGNLNIYWVQGSNIVSDLYPNFSTIFITHSNVSEVPSMKKQTSKKKTKTKTKHQQIRISSMSTRNSIWIWHYMNISNAFLLILNLDYVNFLELSTTVITFQLM